MITAYFDESIQVHKDKGLSSLGIYLEECDCPILYMERVLEEREKDIVKVGLKGLIESLKLLLSLDIKEAEIKGDCLAVFALISTKKPKNKYLEMLIEAKNLMSSFENICLAWVPREKNKQADKLSKSAIKNLNIIKN